MARAALRLCGLAAAAWPLAARAAGADELAMVQSMLELSHQHQFEEDSEQFPTGVFPVPEMPAPNVTVDGLLATVGDMTPQVNSIKLINDLLEAFRDDYYFGQFLQFSENVTEGVVANARELKAELDEANAGQLPTEPAEAFTRAAKVLLALERKMKWVQNVTQNVAAPLNAKLNNAIRVELFLDPQPLFDRTDRAFAPSRSFLESHANKTSQVSDRDSCKEFNAVLVRVAKNQRHLEEKANFFENLVFNNTEDSIDKSPTLLLAPDLVPKFRQWAKVAGQTTEDLSDSYQDVHTLVIQMALRLLDDAAHCKLDEEKISHGTAASTHVGGLALLLSAAAALVASALGDW